MDVVHDRRGGTHCAQDDYSAFLSLEGIDSANLSIGSAGWMGERDLGTQKHAGQYRERGLRS